MERELNIWVVGGDLRQLELAKLLSDDGHTVHTYALAPPHSAWSGAHIQTTLEKLELADCVILPLPVASGDGRITAPLSAQPCLLEQVLSPLSPTQFLCGGRVDEGPQSIARSKGLFIRDYFAQEELAVANAVPTAEGAIQLAMERLPITVHGSRALVLGFGRIGSLCAQRFQALGARVTVAARRYEHLSWAQALSMDVQPLVRPVDWLCSYDLIVNTIPAQILGAEELTDVRKSCLILDLASAPGGVDLEAARQLGIQAVHALSLPGKVAPATAGRAIRDTVYHMLEEYQGKDDPHDR